MLKMMQQISNKYGHSCTPGFNFSDVHFLLAEMETRLLTLQNKKKKSLRRFACFLSGSKKTERISIYSTQSEGYLPSEFTLGAADFSTNFQAFMENYSKRNNTFFNVHLLCKKHFIDCFLVLSLVFEKY